ncbi:hypothetical protein HPP92_011577 [Vanilla planifolia]|uniref:C3H1-type domain-containing protein n=1 Tax=Vanilla planifolia TaxID=51239 RepID=A0A835R4G1_VANPL|nr:hypothetical protein HPP92_011577 [Vanilla planifolia]
MTPNTSSSTEGGNASTLIPISDDASADLFEKQRHLTLVELQNLIYHYNEAFLQLQRTISDLDALKEENLMLATENMEILSLVEEQKKYAVYPYSMTLPSSSSSSSSTSTSTSTITASTTTVTDFRPSHPDSKKERIWSLPSYPPFGRDPGSVGTRRPLRLRLPTTTALQEEGDGNGEVEVEAYNQGTAKTELCNKWGEMGWCPYAGKCQFAHGIEELRPVVRHPLYKTQICRMLGAGGGCPYGHRCHFRHVANPGSRDR